MPSDIETSISPQETEEHEEKRTYRLVEPQCFGIIYRII